MRYVIIGNSTAGTAAIEAIRESEQNGKITVVCDERYANYSRPLISYLLAKKVSLEQIPFRSKEFYQKNKLELLLGKQAARLNTKQKTVVLSDSTRLTFDRLLIATGGRAFIPQIKGRDAKGVFSFIRLSDALAIDKYIVLNKVKRAVVIGGGLIGLKATEALIARRIKVTIVELADRILSTTFDQQASGIIACALEKAGCSLITKNTVAQIKTENSKVEEVILKDGKKIHSDLVIVAVGTQPNITLLKDTAIKTNKGILVDNFMQTNIKGIYAAGDCSEAKDALLGLEGSIAIWPVAARGGKIAGYNMSGKRYEYADAFAMNSVELCGIATISAGETLPQAGCEVLEHFAPKQSIYKKIVLKDNRIVGFIFVGDIERSGIYTGLIKDKVDTTGFKESLLSEDFGLVSLPREYRKHLVTAGVAII